MAPGAPSPGWARPQSKPAGQSNCTAQGRVHILSALQSILPQSVLAVQASPIFLSVMGSGVHPATRTRQARLTMLDGSAEIRRIPASSPVVPRLSNAFAAGEGEGTYLTN